MPTWPSAGNWPTTGARPTAGAWPTAGNWPASFSGNFATLFPGAFQVVQSNLGLTYGGTPLAQGTAPVVGTLTGTLATAPIPILFTNTTPGVIGAGAVFAASYDGGGTQAMTGITPTAGVPVPLTGAAAGLSMAWAAGSALADNTWTATASALSDQSGNAKDYSQVTASRQPTLAVGVNGKVGIAFNATLAHHLDSALAMVAPGTTPYTLYMVFTPAPKAGQENFTGGTAGGGGCIFSTVGVLSSCGMFNGSAVNTSSLTAAPSRVFADFTNSTADRNKMGASAIVTGASAGNLTLTGMTIGAAQSSGGIPANMTLFMFAIAPIMSTAQLSAVDSAVNSALGYGVGSILV